MTRDNFQRMLLRYSLSSRYYKVTYPAATTVSVTPKSMTLPEQVCQPRTSQSLSQSVSRLKNINWFTPSVLLLPLQKRTPLYMHFASPSPESKLFYCHSCFSLPLAVFRNHSPHLCERRHSADNEGSWSASPGDWWGVVSRRVCSFCWGDDRETTAKCRKFQLAALDVWSLRPMKWAR